MQAVAEGLAALGHEVHALTGAGDGPFPAGSVQWHAIGTPGGRPQLRLLRARAVERIARRISPDVVIERYHNFGGEGVLAARRTGARTVLEVNAPIVEVPGSSKSRLDRATLVRPLERWRDWQVRHADLVVTPSARIVPAWVPPARILELEWGADTDRFHPGAPGHAPWTREPSTTVAIFAGAFRAWHGAIQLVDATRRLHDAGRTDLRAVLIGDGPERAAAERAAGAHPGIQFTGALPYEAMPAALAAADIGVAPFDAARHPPLALDFYWSPLKIFEYMASGLPVVAPALERLTRLVTDQARRRVIRPVQRRRARSGARAGLRASPPRGDGPCRPGPRGARLQLEGSLRVPRRGLEGHRVTTTTGPLRVLIVTDSFPPNCGGSGWSTFELARGLRARGHAVDVVQPKPGRPGRSERRYDDFVVDEIGATAPAVPYVRNYFKNERLWRQLASVLDARTHGAHLRHRPCAARADDGARHPRGARAPGACAWPPCVTTGRSATGRILIIDPASDSLCPELHAGNMSRCVRPRAGAAWPLALPMIPYMRANLTRKRTTLAKADAVIAVSSVIAADLRARAPELSGSRVEHIPNPVDLSAIQRDGVSAAAASHEPYLLYCGKLEVNKGADLLVRVVREAGCRLPLVVVGEGRLRQSLEAEAREAGVDLRVLGWLPREEALGWLRHASALVFPSRGPESLSRVLLEAGALGVPIAAMNTGGTADIIRNGETGLLSPPPTRSPATSHGCSTIEHWPRDLGAAAREYVHRDLRRAPVHRPHRGALPDDRLPDDARAAAPRRIAVVGRSVYALHGVGGLERHLYDLVRYHWHAGWHVTLITRTPERLEGADPDAWAVVRDHPRCRVRFVPVLHVSPRRTTRHDDPRPQHGVSLVRDSRRAPGGRTGGGG